MSLKTVSIITGSEETKRPEASQPPENEQVIGDGIQGNSSDLAHDVRKLNQKLAEPIDASEVLVVIAFSFTKLVPRGDLQRVEQIRLRNGAQEPARSAQGIERLLMLDIGAHVLGPQSLGSAVPATAQVLADSINKLWRESCKPFSDPKSAWMALARVARHFSSNLWPSY